MEKIHHLCTFLTLVLFSIVALGQEPNTDIFKPIPLQSLTPPKNAAFKENKLILYDMIDKEFDTLSLENYDNPKREIDLKGNGQRNLKDKNNPDYIFSNMLPTDQLAEFPNYPMSAVVKLFLTFYNPVTKQNSFGTCSGVMIQPEYLLTAAHCVKSKFDSSYVVSCNVVPAYNLGKRPFGVTTTTNWYAFSQWTNNGNLDFDIAIMKVSQPIGNTTGWMDLSYQTDSSFFTSTSNVFYNFGYPGYDPLGNPVFEEGERMYYRYGYMDFWLTPNRVCHNNIGYSGMSGSGLIYDDSSRNRKVYGVLSGGNVFPPHHTCHCRLDSGMYAYFKSIIPNINKLNSYNLTKQVLIYPNPSSGKFTLDINDINSGNIKIHIYDLLGRLVYIEMLDRAPLFLTIDLKELANGPYSLQVNLNGKTEFYKIMKME